MSNSKLSATTLIDTPRCNALESNALDSFDLRAWQTLARNLERDFEEMRGFRLYHSDQVTRLAKAIGALGETSEDVVTQAIEKLSVASHVALPGPFKAVADKFATHIEDALGNTVPIDKVVEVMNAYFRRDNPPTVASSDGWQTKPGYWNPMDEKTILAMRATGVDSRWSPAQKEGLCDMALRSGASTQRTSEPVAWLWERISGIDAGKRVARTDYELDHTANPYPTAWKLIGPLFEASTSATASSGVEWPWHPGVMCLCPECGLNKATDRGAQSG